MSVNGVCLMCLLLTYKHRNICNCAIQDQYFSYINKFENNVMCYCVQVMRVVLIVNKANVQEPNCLTHVLHCAVRAVQRFFGPHK